MSEKYIFCSKDTLEVRNITPYINLTFAISGGLLKTNSKVVNDIANVVSTILRTLTDREQTILICRYGLNGEEPKTLEQIGKGFGLTKERIRQLEAKALRKMRHPSRSRMLRGYRVSPDFSRGYISAEYEERLIAILKEEIQGIVRGYDGKTVYLNSIVRKNNMEIVNLTKESDVYDISDEEIEENNRKYNCKNDGYNTILLIRNEEKTLFKYTDDDTQKIANSLFREIFSESDLWKDLFHSAFSPGLKDILLQKGYLYEKDVYNEADMLEEQLRTFGFSEYAQEIATLKECKQTDFIECERVYIYKVSKNIINFIQNNGCSTLKEFAEVAKNTECKDAMDIAEELTIWLSETE